MDSVLCCVGRSVCRGPSVCYNHCVSVPPIQVARSNGSQGSCSNRQSVRSKMLLVGVTVQLPCCGGLAAVGVLIVLGAQSYKDEAGAFARLIFSSINLK